MPDLTRSDGWFHDRVCDLRRRTRRRTFDTLLEVFGGDGQCPSAACCIPAGEVLDHELRVDLLVRLLQGGEVRYDGRPRLVVTRSGPDVVGATDLAWLAGWTAACGVTGVTAGTTWALGRYGFADVADGSWIRTEPRRHRR